MLLLCLLLGCPLQVSAQDCSGSYIQLTSQTAVNAFQANHGPCTRVTSFIDIEDFKTPGNEIVDLTPLSALTEVGATMWISGTSVTSLAGLENLVSVETLSISGNTSLGSLAALENLAAVQNLTIWGNSSLTSLTTWAGLSSLAGLGILSIGENSLTDLAGLPSLFSLDDLTLGENNLGGLPATLSQVGTLSFAGSLPGINGLSNSLQVTILRIQGTTNLTSLDGLPALTGLEKLFIEENEELVDLGGLAASSFSQADPAEMNVRINWNFNLESLVGIPTPPRFGYLEISNNPSLTSLAGLAGLQETWSNLWVIENGKLADCESLRIVLDEVDDGDPGPGTSMDPADPPDTYYGLAGVTIEDNRSFDPDLPPPQRGCNSIAEILSTDSDVIHKDGFEGG